MESIIKISLSLVAFFFFQTSSAETQLQVYTFNLPSDNLEVSISFTGSELQASSIAAISYQWLHNGNDIEGANDPNYTPTSSGVYSCQVMDDNGCTAISSESFNLEVGIYLLGCTQFCAINYNPNASLDDGSCLYNGIGGGNGCQSCPGDFNNDGLVTTSDLTVFLAAFGSICF